MGAQVNVEFLKIFEDDWLLLSDLTDFMFGEHIGTGSERSVYSFNFNKKYVVKIDRAKKFSNVVEWEIWNNLQDHEIGKFLCPCISISSCGRFLLQEKTTPVKLEDMPNEIPDCFTDVKIENWGRIGKRIVCHDYANHRFMSGDNFKMVKPEWWSLNYQILPDNVKKIIDDLKVKKDV